MAMGVFGSFKGLDAFGRAVEDVKVKTRTGALLTLASALFIFIFTLIEFMDFRKIHVDTSIVVDRSRGEKLQVLFNMTFPRVPCYLLNLDITDISGTIVHEFSHEITKIRLDPKGLVPIHNEGPPKPDLGNDLDKVIAQSKESYCGPCYGGVAPEGGCCQTCEDVRQAYINAGWSFNTPDLIEQCVKEHWTEKIQKQWQEGCNISGRVRVNKVAGNLQFSPGRAFVVNKAEVYEIVPYLKESNHFFGHIIHSLEIIDHDEMYGERLALPPYVKEKLGITENSLDSVYAHTEAADYMFQYFLKVVKSSYRTVYGDTYKTHQYSASSYERNLATGEHGKNEEGVALVHERTGVPGAFFNFDISPMEVVHIESRQSWAHFLTSMAAIVGGVLTVASLLDILVFNTQGLIKKGASQVKADSLRPYAPAPPVKML